MESPNPNGALDSPTEKSNRLFNNKITVDDLIEKLGAHPVTDIKALAGGFWPSDESEDEFVDALRQWRNDDLVASK